MKKFLSILVVLAVVCSAAKANIDDPKSGSGMAVVKSGDVFKLIYKGVKPGDIKVTIYNAQGKTIFQETLHKLASFVRPYNFSSIAEGEYTLELEGENGKQVQSISHRNEASALPMKLVAVSGATNKYVLSVPNQGAGLMQVKIYDNTNGLVYDRTEKLDGNFARVYNLTDIGSGFSFEVTDVNGVTQTLVYER
jgi:hypothetical protein